MGPTWGPLGPVGPRWAPCWPHEPCNQCGSDTFGISQGKIASTYCVYYFYERDHSIKENKTLTIHYSSKAKSSLAAVPQMLLNTLRLYPASNLSSNPSPTHPRPPTSKPHLNLALWFKIRLHLPNFRVTHSLRHNDAIWRYRTWSILVKVNGLLPEPMLTKHRRGFEAFTWVHFKEEMPRIIFLAMTLKITEFM